MKIIYAREKQIAFDLPSIFLAGCTPRDKFTPSWRADAVRYLQTDGFEGVVYVPENESWGLSEADYEAQVYWEWDTLDLASCIAFWIPRDLDTMPGFTSNVEFGLYATSGKIIAGGPSEAVKNRYLQMIAERYKFDWLYDLKSLMQRSIEIARHKYEVCR